MIHVEVRKLYPDAATPSVTTRALDDRSIEVTYGSSRGLWALAEGLILGAGDLFDEPLAVTRQPEPRRMARPCFMLHWLKSSERRPNRTARTAACQAEGARLQAEGIAEKGLRDLYLANQNLDSVVTERTLELQQARIELERSAERREAFLASLSRQVRTPLNGVVGMLDLLEGHLSDPQGRSYVSSAKGSADDLLRSVLTPDLVR